MKNVAVTTPRRHSLQRQPEAGPTSPEQAVSEVEFSASTPDVAPPTVEVPANVASAEVAGELAVSAETSSPETVEDKPHLGPIVSERPPRKDGKPHRRVNKWAFGVGLAGGALASVIAVTLAFNGAGSAEDGNEGTQGAGAAVSGEQKPGTGESQAATEPTQEPSPTDIPSPIETQPVVDTVATYPISMEVPREVAQDSSLQYDIMKGTLYETLDAEQKARVDTWYAAIYETGTFFELPESDRAAAVNYILAANYATTMKHVNMSNRRGDINNLLSHVVPASVNNTPTEIDYIANAQFTLAGFMHRDAAEAENTTTMDFDYALANVVGTNQYANRETRDSKLNELDQIYQEWAAQGSVGYFAISPEEMAAIAKTTGSTDPANGTALLRTETADGRVLEMPYRAVAYQDVNGEKQIAWYTDVTDLLPRNP